MRRGDRIKLIRRIADRLEPERDFSIPDDESDPQYDQQAADMRFELREFGLDLPEWHSDTNSLRDLILEALSNGTDDTLEELVDYLFGGPSVREIDTEDLQWEPGTVKVFLSHTHQNAELASKVRGFFLPWRIDTFVAHKDIEPTREWERVIDAQLRTCDVLVALLTPEFKNSSWCDQEVGFCFGRGAPVIGVRLPEDPHGFMSRFQGVTITDPNAEEDDPPRPAWVADGIFRSLARHSALAETMMMPIVHRFAQSTHTEGASSNFDLVSEIPENLWTREMVEIAERASHSNDHVKHAAMSGDPKTPLPDALKKLLVPVRARLGLDVPQPVSAVADDDIPF